MRFGYGCGGYELSGTLEPSPVPHRLMGLVLDNRWRNQGIGGHILEKVIADIYQEFCVRPIVLEAHGDNCSAARFYTKHGFRKTDVMEGNDYYYHRYPV